MNLIAGEYDVICSFICFSFKLDVNHEVRKKLLMTWQVSMQINEGHQVSKVSISILRF